MLITFNAALNVESHVVLKPSASIAARFVSTFERGSRLVEVVGLTT